MARVSVQAQDSHVHIELDNELILDLDRNAAMAMMAALAKALNDLRADYEENAKPDELASFRSLNPSYRIGMTRDGDPMFTFIQQDAAPFEIQFSREQTIILNEKVAEALEKSKKAPFAQ